MENRSDLDRLTDELWDSMHIREKDLLFIRLYAEHRHDTDAWKTLFATVDLQTEPYVFNCLLTRLGAGNDWSVVPAELVPTLNGLRKKLIASNAVQIMDCLKLVRELNAKNIPVLVIKCGALRLALLPDLPRSMTDIDLVVPKERFKESCAAGLAEGRTADDKYMHSVDLHYQNRSCVDLHDTVFKNNVLKDEPTEKILLDSTETERQGARFFVPCPEDAFLITMINAVGNFLQGTDKGPVSWLADCIDLADAYTLDYSRIIHRAEECGITPQFTAALALMRRFLPEKFAELYQSAADPVSRRSVKRMRKFLKVQLDTPEDLSGLVFPVRAYRRLRFLKAYYTGMHHLDDPLPVILKDLPVMMKRWRRVEHLYQVPADLIKVGRKWKKEYKEAEHAEIE